jgi:hypothetical protein
MARKSLEIGLGPSEQRTPEISKPFAGGGRRADLNGGYDQRAAANRDWEIQLTRNSRQDREAVGQKTDTGWVGTGLGHPRGRK